MREKPMSNLDVNEIARSVQQRTLHVEVMGEVEEGREADCEQEIDSEVEKTRGNGGVEKH